MNIRIMLYNKADSSCKHTPDMEYVIYIRRITAQLTRYAEQFLDAR
jgi:hypothetical protein